MLQHAVNIRMADPTSSMSFVYRPARVVSRAAEHKGEEGALVFLQLVERRVGEEGG
jgi:hypothetical protein